MSASHRRRLLVEVALTRRKRISCHCSNPRRCLSLVRLAVRLSDITRWHNRRPLSCAAEAARTHFVWPGVQEGGQRADGKRAGKMSRMTSRTRSTRRFYGLSSGTLSARRVAGFMTPSYTGGSLRGNRVIRKNSVKKGEIILPNSR